MSRRSFNDPHGQSDEARQGLLDNRCERLHPKRHRTNKRAKRLSAKKRAEIRAASAKRLADKRRYDARVKSYFSGEAADHP